jgi:hypothetical protein
MTTTWGGFLSAQASNRQKPFTLTIAYEVTPFWVSSFPVVIDDANMTISKMLEKVANENTAPFPKGGFLYLSKDFDKKAQTEFLMSKERTLLSYGITSDTILYITVNKKELFKLTPYNSDKPEEMQVALQASDTIFDLKLKTGRYPEYIMLLNYYTKEPIGLSDVSSVSSLVSKSFLWRLKDSDEYDGDVMPFSISVLGFKKIIGLEKAQIFKKDFLVAPTNTVYFLTNSMIVFLETMFDKKIRFGGGFFKDKNGVVMEYNRTFGHYGVKANDVLRYYTETPNE